MVNISDLYVRSVHDNLSPLYSNWEPSRPITIGAVGELRGENFVIEGHLNDYGIPFTVGRGKGMDYRTFCTDESAEIQCNPSIAQEATGTSGRIEICFKRGGCVFFSAAGCTYTTVKKKPALAQAIMQRFESGQWNRRWAVVTDLVEARTAVIAVSGGNSANLGLDVKSQVGEVNLGNAALSIRVASEHSIAYKVVADNGLPLLLGLSKIQGLFWLGGRLRTMNLLDDSDDFELPEDEQQLAFAQLR